MKLHEVDIIYLSYNEHNAEELYSKNLEAIPWLQRVHGVKGFDSAHRACADLSTTDFFVTIDGDNLVKSEFLDVNIDITNDQQDHAWTWSSRNSVNGLVYGNGGIKLWSKQFVYNMNTHENATDQSKSVDFCWHKNYHEMEGCYSTSIVNPSAEQAWRSGFREGVKMSLDQGMPVTADNFLKQIWPGNVTRLLIWASVGADVENGYWAMLGARMGCYKTVIEKFDYKIISDYNAMHDAWQSIKNNNPLELIQSYDKDLKNKIGLSVTLLSPDNSKFFKSVYMNPPRPFISWDRIKHFMAQD